MTIAQLNEYVAAQLAVLGLPSDSDAGKTLSAFVSYVQHKEDVANAVSILTEEGYTVSPPVVAVSA